MSRTWKRIRNRLLGRRPAAVPVPSIGPLMMGLQMTLEREMGCAEADALMAALAEAVEGGASQESLEAQFTHHLAMCPDCRQEFDALLRVLAAEQA
jgi:hypothetical protein